MRQLSILIPNCNQDCTRIVMDLHRQCCAIKNLCFDITVVDDGSDDKYTIKANSILNNVSNTRYEICHKVSNRSAMRNRMHRYGSYEWVLSVNSNVQIYDDQFVSSYLDAIIDEKTVLCGYSCAERDEYNLRCMDEYNVRRHCFRNTNYLCHRSVFENVHYDERIQGYGYEDVQFGKDLIDKGYMVQFVDIGVYYTAAISNEQYLQKVEESMHTLKQLESRHTDAVRLLKFKDSHKLFCGVLRVVFPCLYRLIRHNLTGEKPIIQLLPLYKLGYYLSKCE